MATIAFLEVDANEINRMSPEALQKFAEEQSTEILRKIEDSVKIINEYQNKAINSSELDGFEHVKNFFSGGTYKRDKDQKALRTSLESMRADSGNAMLSMVNLIQESVKFTCTSIKLAQCMHSTMAVMMARGFNDRDGNLHQLDENTQEFARYIINQADMFVSNQAEFNQRIDNLEQFRIDVETIEKEQDLRIDKAIKTAENNTEKLKSISRKELSHDRQIKEQAQKDLEHDNAIKAGEEKDAEQDAIIAAHTKKDAEHDKRLKLNDKKNAEQDEKLLQQSIKDVEHDKLISALIDRNNELAIENKHIKRYLAKAKWILGGKK